MRILSNIFALLIMLMTAQPLLAADVPHWVNEITQGPLKYRPQQIVEYRYQGAPVFMLVAKCCDQYNRVLDVHGATICAPSGGISGRGDGECPDFYEQAVRADFEWHNDGKLTVTESPETLRALLMDESQKENDRLLAAEKIVQICDSRKECVLPLAAVFAFKGSYYTLWQAARNQLCRLHAKAEGAIPSLSAVLADRDAYNDWRAWVFSMEALACIGKDAARIVPLLIDILKDPEYKSETYIQQTAVETLAAFGPAASKSLPELKRLQESDHADLHKAVRQAIVKIRGK